MQESMPLSEYEKWVGRLYRTPLFHPSNPRNGQIRMKKLHGLLGSPMNDPDIAIMHIAGTNGKGSVGLKLATSFTALGFSNVGLYSSPHVSCFRERIQWTNGQLISEDEVAEGLATLFGLCQEHDIPATFFELVTLLAFRYFHQCHTTNASPPSSGKMKKTIIVLETGLGGRWDATNVIEAPMLAIITSIGLDHTNVLGTTKQQIALEKAGIMKPQSLVLVGYQVPHDTLRQYAKEHGIMHYHTTEEVLARDVSTTNGNSISNGQDSASKDAMDYNATNTRIVQAALLLLQQHSALDLPSDIPPELLQKAISVRPPCRFETVQNTQGHKTMVILDVAHNPPAMQALVYKLQTANPDKKIRVVLGVSKDKDWKGVLDALIPLTGAAAGPNNNDNDSAKSSLLTRVHLVQASHYKALPLVQLVQDIEDQAKREHTALDTGLLRYNLQDPTVKSGLLDAMKFAQRDELIVVCGSVFLMAEARRTLGIQEPCDSDYLMEILRSGGGASVFPGSLKHEGVIAFGNGERAPPR
ncbi:Probable bifunctional folylpolyglutamate synthase/dihydropteroate synthase [Seminavis robusta]|uniref:Probable bifunctional folylpolyglutamate synthase/dihydropteroate synthase n=1 Tax=Seminavis robusta TaxID=568900 RepID=A0A9N8ETH3_9STRA|nr:Probable bifunctional folylpolyglutamate synthase/dihydropteroate synthase [Seminavis robusta]|eukprot:Sro1535_g280520.1 Probable bifunctional folylpolyglutamate synthase/dihydropteroate synthase (527) ;mRNA; r:10064-11728